MRSTEIRHGVIVISNRKRGHDYDYDCELVIIIDYIHGKYNVIAIVIEYFTKVIEIMITYHDYMIFFPSFYHCHIYFVGLIIRNILTLPAHIFAFKGVVDSTKFNCIICIICLFILFYVL